MKPHGGEFAKMSGLWDGTKLMISLPYLQAFAL
jgi:hypothetical protein